jgi:hypothetical protein
MREQKKFGESNEQKVNLSLFATVMSGTAKTAKITTLQRKNNSKDMRRSQYLLSLKSMKSKQ